jgi:O-methyltransferase domain
VRAGYPTTFGADKRYGTRDCVQTLRAQGVTPYAAQNTTGRRSAADRCDFVGGDFFSDEVPAGADTYLLSAILHDWDDKRCEQILRNCRRAISETGHLLVVDIVLSDEKNTPDTYRNCLDLAVMLQLGGMERTESEFRDLLTSAGFNLCQVLTMNAPQSVLVAVPE